MKKKIGCYGSADNHGGYSIVTVKLLTGINLNVALVIGKLGNYRQGLARGNVLGKEGGHSCKLLTGNRSVLNNEVVISVDLHVESGTHILNVLVSLYSYDIF